jgi:hypothetical protein
MNPRWFVGAAALAAFGILSDLAERGVLLGAAP